ncbi:MAG: transporter substrate-binding domain-containing protein [Planctomycetes bacterium]|nr:transporter substrate-binding domain-containing protein [Planctomycetota bacterium]
MRILITLFCLLLVSCQTTQNEYALQQNDHWHRVSESQEIRIGVKKNSPPFSTLTEDGQFWGFDIDMAQEISSELGLRLKLVPLSASERIPYLKQGKVDIVIATMTQTQFRDEQVDFSVPYFKVEQGIMSLKNSEIVSFLDLYHKKVGVVEGTQSLKNVKDQQPDSSIVSFKSYNDLMEGLNNGEVDAIVSDYLILLGLLNKSPYMDKFRLDSQSSTSETYAIAVNENQSNLRDQINHSLMVLWEKNIWQDAFLTWFGEGSIYFHDSDFHINVWAK